MSVLHPTSSGLANAGPAFDVGAALARLWRRFRNRRTISALDGMSDAALDDIGLTRFEVTYALALPLTDDPSTHLSQLVHRRRRSDPPWRGDR